MIQIIVRFVLTKTDLPFVFALIAQNAILVNPLNSIGHWWDSGLGLDFREYRSAVDLCRASNTAERHYGGRASERMAPTIH